MNAKKAKQLRKLAAQMATEVYSTKTLGNSKRFVVEPVAQVEGEEVGLAGNIPLPSDAIGQQPKIHMLAGSVMVNPNSARGIYKQLKKAAAQQ